MNQSEAVQAGKIAAVWATIGITSWTDAASFLAFILSFLALCEYLWKKALKPLAIRLGWIKE